MSIYMILFKIIYKVVDGSPDEHFRNSESIDYGPWRNVSEFEHSRPREGGF